MEKFTFTVSDGGIKKGVNASPSEVTTDDKYTNDEREEGGLGIVTRQKRDSKRRKAIGFLCVLGIIILGFFLIVMLRHYNNYEVVSSIKVKDASAHKFEEFNGGLLKYGNDGAILRNVSGKVVWNVGFEMSDPRIDICGKYVIIYDREGSKIFLLDDTDKVSEISTNQPIYKAEVSGSGTIAVIMKGDLKSRIELYNQKGETLASGEMHIDKSGYPTDIAINSSGEILMVSSLGYKDGAVVSRVNFYNFGKAGRNSIDNIVSSYKYTGTVIPEVDITASGKPVAFGSNKIICYSNSSKPAEKKVIEPGAQMKSVIHNDKFFGYVVPEEDENGTVNNVLKVYTYRGFKRYSKKIDFEYRDIELMKDNEVMISDGHKLEFVSLFGMNRFYINDDDEIYDVINKRAGREFYFVRSDSVQHVKLSNE